mmetsp:Transcript_1199/g.3085  ORF Transcript_1199/g.3085 Transcript_1199/m.3085 type:complete len:416 (-) Transcript_1199:612-1859(-)
MNHHAPEAASWSLKNASTDQVMQTNPILGGFSETFHEERICVQPGCYVFSMSDGDGTFSLQVGESTFTIGIDNSNEGDEIIFGIPDNSICQDIPTTTTTTTSTPRPTYLRTPSPTPVPSISLVSGCFSGDNTVTVLTGGDTQQQQLQQVPLRNLQIGDLIQTANGLFEPVYSFGHFHPNLEAAFLRITTDSRTSTRPLELTREHMVFVVDNHHGHKKHAIPSSLLKVGDMVQTTKQAATVTKIERVHQKGVYAPFTSSGTIVVNQEIVASTFVAFSDSETLEIGPLLSTGLTYQWLSHSFEAPHRWFCRLFLDSYCKHETYERSTGISVWVYVPWRVGRWFMMDDGNNKWASVSKLLVLLPLVATWSVFWAMEQTMFWVILATGIFFVASCLLLCKKRRATKKMKSTKLRICVCI